MRYSMAVMQNEFILYGLDECIVTINNIINELDAKEYEFDFKIMLSEAIANAFFHGNKGDSTLPIKVKYSLVNETVIFEVADCGEGLDIDVCKIDEPTDILNEGCRGLFLINCYSDSVDYQNNALKIKKTLKKEKRYKDNEDEPKA
jgi:serine/threonine-protein kinase RsbW